MFFILNNSSFWLAFITIIFLTIAIFFFSGKNWLWAVAVLLCICLLAVGTRTAAISAVAVLLLWHYLKKSIKWYMIFLALAICTFSFVIKSGSTNGRWFITKLTAEMLKTNPVGIGFGKFKVQYGLRQAAYFRSHSLNDATALGADNTEFAFNEYLQITVEGGIIAGSFFIFFTITVMIYGCWLYNKKKSPFLLSCLTGFTGVSVSCLTFYMLHSWWVCCFYLLCILGILFYPFMNKLFIRRLFLATGIVAGCILSWKTYRENTLKTELNEVMSLSSSGYKNLADSLLLNLKSGHEDDLSYQTSLALHYLKNNSSEKALSVFEQLTKIISADYLYMYAGDAAVQTGDTAKAAEFYEEAVYLVPKRFITRNRLTSLFKLTGDIEKEKYWLRSIIDLPEKISSEETRAIRKEAGLRFREISVISP